MWLIIVAFSLAGTSAVSSYVVLYILHEELRKRGLGQFEAFNTNESAFCAPYRWCFYGFVLSAATASLLVLFLIVSR